MSERSLRVAWSRSRCVVLLAAGLLLTGIQGSATSAYAQVLPADSASVLLDAAHGFETGGRWDVAEALYRLILERFPQAVAATEARARLAAPPSEVVLGDGSVELRVWMTLFGAGFGLAVPGALGADSSEPYGLGLLLGGPVGFLTGRAMARSMNLTEGQARAITLGGTWGAWQGFGWREVLDIGVRQQCETFGQEVFCYDAEDTSEEVYASMLIGGLTGIAAGALLAGRRVTPGTGSTVNFAALWGSWFGVAGGTLAGLESDDLLAATLVGGNLALVSTALLAPGWNVSRGRARLVSITGVLGGLGGFGIDLLAQPDDEKVAIGIPLAASIIGLSIGIAATRGDGSSTTGQAPGPDGALLGYSRGQLALGTPVLLPTLVPGYGEEGTVWRPAVSLELFRAAF